MRIFSYGSNMCFTRLHSRVPSTKFVTIGKLQSYTLLLNKRSRKDHSGKANAFLTNNEADYVLGAIFEIVDNEKYLLDVAEGLHHGYDEIILPIETDGGEIINAQMYIANPAAIDNELIPFDWYLNYIITGAQDYNLQEEYIAKLQAIQTVYDTNIERREDYYRIMQQHRLYKYCKSNNTEDYKVNLEIHEAGHVVARLLNCYNIPAQGSEAFDKIEIKNELDSGNVRIKSLFTDEELNYFNPGNYLNKVETRNKLLKEASIKLAGVAAECALNNRPVPITLSSPNLYKDIVDDFITAQRCVTNIMLLDEIKYGTLGYEEQHDRLGMEILHETISHFKNKTVVKGVSRLSNILKEKPLLEKEDLTSVIYELGEILKPFNV